MQTEESRDAGAPARLLTPAFVVITASALALFLNIGMALPVLPLYVEDVLQGGAVAIGLAAGIVAVAAVLGRPAMGFIGDRKGRKILMIGGAALVAVTTLGTALVQSYAALLALRFLLGFGEGAFFVGAATLINDLAPAHRRGEAASYFSVAIYTGIGLGPVLGEAVLDGDRFRLAWLAATGFAVVAVLIALLAPDRRPEAPGTAAAGTDAADPAPTHRWIHPAGLGPGLVLALGIMGFTGFGAFVPIYVEDIGMADSGGVFLLYAAIVLVIRIGGARIPDRFGTARTSRLGLLAIAAGLALAGLWRTVPGLFLGTAVLAVGMALLYPALMALAVSRAPEQERAAVVATFTGFFDLAAGVGGLVFGAVVALTSEPTMFVVGGAIAASGLLVLQRVTHRPAEPAPAAVRPGPAAPGLPVARPPTDPAASSPPPPPGGRPGR